jgi:UDP-N-acetylmuramate--alanine ligase
VKLTPEIGPDEPVPVSQLGRVHFTGIGGSGMSGIARILLARGVAVSGSDARQTPLTGQLAALGADVHAGHDAANLGDLGAGDTLVVSTAIAGDNPELAGARRRGLRILHRGAALASVTAGRRVVAVAGTHGKTTTAAMLATILQQCGAAPGYLIGGTLMNTGLGADDGAGEVFVAEADESDRSFLLLAPHVAIVTNVEADHLDNYGGLAEVEDSFAAFTRRIQPGGVLITCADDPGARRLAESAAREGLPAGRRSYGTLPGGGAVPGAGEDSAPGGAPDYAVSGVITDGMRTRFGLFPPDRETDGGLRPLRVELAVPGRHNALNAAAALAAAAELGFDAVRVAAALSGFAGTGRRLEDKGEADGVRVLDSYAHHPTELAADLRAARDIVQGPEGAADDGGTGMRPGDGTGGRVIAVFQPHLYSRTRFFAAEFGAALGLADEALVLDVYAAREDPEPGVTGQLVADRVPGGRASYLPDSAAVPGAVAAIAKPGDLVLTMGAGDVTALGAPILAALRERAAPADAR